MTKPIVSAIAAIGKNRELGKDNKLLWHIPEDLKRFKELTKGHPIVMGVKTFESIVGYLGKPLPGRTNIVISHDPAWKYDDVIVVHTIEEAIQKGTETGTEEIFIGGGAYTYKMALPHVDKLYLTLIDDTKDADSFFPEYESEFTKKVFEESHESDGLKYSFVDLERS